MSRRDANFNETVNTDTAEAMTQEVINEPAPVVNSTPILEKDDSGKRTGIKETTESKKIDKETLKKDAESVKMSEYTDGYVSPLDKNLDSFSRKKVVYDELEDTNPERTKKLNDEEAIKSANAARTKKEDDKSKKKDKNKEGEEGKKKKGPSIMIFNSDGKAKEIHRIRKTVQDTIPFRNVYKNGIIEVEEGIFSKSYILDDINFKIAHELTQESMFKKYGDFLNKFGAECKISITINNKRIDVNEFRNDTLIKPAGDGLDEYRQEMNDMLMEKMSQGRNNLTHEKYFTVSIHSKNIEDATVEFSRIDATVHKYIPMIASDSKVKTMSLMERLQVLFDVYHLDDDYSFNMLKSENDKKISTIDLAELNRQGLSIKDVIGPASFEFKNNNNFRVGKYWGQALYIQSFPTELNTDLLSDITDVTADMFCTVHFEPMTQKEAIKMIKNRTVAINSAVVDAQKQANQAGYSSDLISPELIAQQEEAIRLRDDVTKRNQKLFFITLCITHFAKTRQDLETNYKAIETVLNGHLCVIKPLTYQQEYGFQSSLPIGINRVKETRLVTTESASVFIPYSAQEWQDAKGEYYGINTTSRNMIRYNIKNGSNYNSFILGTPGSGKSFSSKRSIVNKILNSSDQVYVIDPEREYTALCQILNGTVIKIAPGTKIRINPLDLDIDDVEEDQDPIAAKQGFVESLCAVMLQMQYGCTPFQKTVINRCLRIIYDKYIKIMQQRKAINELDTVDPSICPTLEDFYRCLKAQPEAEADELAMALELYIKGTLNTFGGRTNIDVDGRFVVFDIKDIDNMMELGVQVCLNTIWNQIIANKKKNLYTHVYIDEAHLFARRTSSAEYIRNIYKRARKYQGCPCCMTQEVNDFLQSQICRTVVNTSELVVLLNQDVIDREILSDMYGLSEEETACIATGVPGTGLLLRSFGKSRIPFTDEFPKDTKLYRAMSTKAGEVNSFV